MTIEHHNNGSSKHPEDIAREHDSLACKVGGDMLKHIYQFLPEADGDKIFHVKYQFGEGYPENGIFTVTVKAGFNEKSLEALGFKAGDHYERRTTTGAAIENGDARLYNLVFKAEALGSLLDREPLYPARKMPAVYI